MLLKELGEFGLIERIRRATPTGRGVRIGIGDDAAWLEARNHSFLITSDLLIEGIHFELKWTSFYALGYKTLAVNISDLAAMGANPAYLILSLGIPVDFKTEDVEEFYRGIRALASRSGVSLVGGDTSASRHFFISASLVGHSPYRPITRGGGKVGGRSLRYRDSRRLRPGTETPEEKRGPSKGEIFLSYLAPSLSERPCQGRNHSSPGAARQSHDRRE